jgi:hypothetical protein
MQAAAEEVEVGRAQLLLHLQVRAAALPETAEQVELT